MAKNKKNSAHEEKTLPQFSSLAHGFFCAARAEQAMGEQGAPKASAAIEEAWREMTSPSGLVLMGLLQGDEAWNFFVAEGAQGGAPVLAAGYGERRLKALAKGLADLSKNIEQVSSSEAFVRAGREFAPMLANPTSEKGLAYPALGLGLRATLSGKGAGRKASVVGGAIKVLTGWSEDLDGPTTQALAEGEEQLRALDWVRQGRDIDDFENYLPTDLLSERPSLAALGSVGEALNSALKGESALPSVEALRKAAKEEARYWSGESPFDETRAHIVNAGRSNEKLANVRALSAARMLGQAGFSALSAAWAPSKPSFDLVGREVRRGLGGGPWAQATVGEWDDQGGDNLVELIAPGYCLGSAVLELDAELAARCEEDDTSLDAEGMASWMKNQPPQRVEQALTRAFHLASEGLSQEHLDREEWIYVDGEEFGFNKTLTFGKNQKGLNGLGQLLKRADSRIGLAQWGLRALKTLQEDESIWFDGAASSPTEPGERAREEMLGELRGLGRALGRAVDRFSRAALDEAQRRESAWMALHGLDAAWEQAGASGGQTQQSLAWAQENPLGASLKSQNPLARMAGRCSRALGIRVGGSEDDLIQAMRDELGERGLREDGWTLLRSDESLQERVSEKVLGIMAKQKNQDAQRALEMACQALSACGRCGLDGPHALLFMEELSNFDGDTLRQGLKPATVRNVAGARLIEDLALAKQEKLPKLFDALARDWKASRDGAIARGLPESVGLQIAKERCKAFGLESPGGDADWRGCDLDGREAWEFYSAAAPDLEATVAAANAEGGLAAWCAQLSAKFSIRQAVDSNDLIGQVKARIKEAFGLGEGAWKMAVKSPTLQRQLLSAAQSLQSKEDRVEANWPKEGSFAKRSLASQLMDDERGLTDSPATRAGLALNIAASQGLAGEPVAAVLAAFAQRPESELLFSLSVRPQSVDGAQAAAFFRQEAQAKASRLPKIFKEACRRFEKLASDREKAVVGAGETPLSASEIFSSELADLADWLKGSEHGLWQTLPQEPTWGQLSRLSREWHDELAAKEADRVSREQAKQAEREFERRFAPFAPHSGERWAMVLGRFERDGWEAVELASQSELSEEGKAMSHCVSGYSGHCRQGTLRIFSIRLNGERKCTMELRPASGQDLGDLGEHAQFKITQNRGRHNAEVSNKAVRDFCQEAAQAASASWQTKRAQTQDLIAKDQEEKRLAKEAQKAKRIEEKKKLAATDETAASASKPKSKKRPG